MSIHDIHERFTFESVSMYGKRKKNLRNEPTEQLISLRRNCKSYVAYQPPYNNSIGVNQWNDISIYNEARGIDCRIEVKSLETEGSLNETILGHITESKNIPEKELIIVLFGIGFGSKVLKNAFELINETKAPVRIFMSVNELLSYLNQ